MNWVSPLIESQTTKHVSCMGRLGLGLTDLYHNIGKAGRVPRAESSAPKHFHSFCNRKCSKFEAVDIFFSRSSWRQMNFEHRTWPFCVIWFEDPVIFGRSESWWGVRAESRRRFCQSKHFLVHQNLSTLAVLYHSTDDLFLGQTQFAFLCRNEQPPHGLRPEQVSRSGKKNDACSIGRKNILTAQRY